MWSHSCLSNCREEGIWLHLQIRSHRRKRSSRHGPNGITARKKHGIPFEQARQVFATGNDYLEIFDDAHSDDEDRFIAIGPIDSSIVVVLHVEQGADTVRLVSARWATLREIEMHRSYVGGDRR